MAALAGSPTGPSAIRPRRCRHILVFGRVVLRRRPRPVIRVGPCAALTAVAAAILALRRRGSAALRAVRGAAGPCGTDLGEDGEEAISWAAGEDGKGGGQFSVAGLQGGAVGWIGRVAPAAAGEEPVARGSGGPSASFLSFKSAARLSQYVL